MADRYVVTCGCGQCLEVGPSEAGSSVQCDCGSQVAVPSLSRLRTQSGADPYESGAVEAIRRMLDRGELPAGTCAGTGRPTRDVLALTVLVSNFTEPSKEGRDAEAALVLLTGFLGALINLFRRSSFSRPLEGTETVVPAPIYLEARHHRRARKDRQVLLKRWLRTVPIYARLLKEYPYSTVTLPETP